MLYVDGFLLPVPKKKLGEYQKMAVKGGKIWKKHGALGYFECAADDIGQKWSTIKFPKAAKAKPSETVIFSFIIYKSKAHRDAVNKRVMSDPSMGPEQWKDKPLPFDMKRMAVGGFKVIVQY